MPEHIVAYIPIFVITLLVVGVVLGIFIANEILGPKRRSKEEGEAFECGNPPSAGTRRRLSAKSYIIGSPFPVLVGAAVFLFPWAAEYKTFLATGDYAFVALAEMLLFVGVLSFGLVYVWKRGALRWE